MEKPAKVTLDRSALHGERFVQLARPTLEAIDRGTIVGFHTSTFVRESLQLSEHNMKTLLAESDFILRFGNGGYFLPHHELRIRELRGELDTELLSWVEADPLRKLLRSPHPLLTDDQWRLDCHKRQATKRILKDGLIEYRKSVHGAAKSDGHPVERVLREQQGIRYGAKTAVASLVDFGSELLHVVFEDLPDREDLVARWAADPLSFTYSTHLVHGLDTAFSLAIAGSRADIDRNAQDDIELISVAQSVDVLVSEDFGFMKKVFRALIPEGPPRLMSVDEYLYWLSSLAGA